MFKKIIVPLDGSEISECALSPAHQIAISEHAQLVLLSVPQLQHAFVQERGGLGFLLPHQSLELSRKELTNYLEDICQSDRLGDVSRQAMVLDGDSATVIVDTAVSEKADLIVMSTHGRSGFTRWVMGSVAEKVLRGAQCPVLVVRHEKPIKRLLITVDGSELAEEAVEPGFKLAEHFNSEVTLLNVIEMPIDVGGALAERSRLISGYSEEHRKLLRQHSEKYLESLVKNRPPINLDVQCAVVESNLVAEGILNFAANKETDLIVMTTHGYTGLKRWAYGSVTEKVIHDAKCGLFIVHLPNNKLNQVDSSLNKKI